MNILNFLSRKQLLKIDKELQELKYKDLITGLDQLRTEAAEQEKDEKKKEKELRVLYAMIDVFTALQKVYEQEGD